jgi:hypothetical protein
MLVGSEDGSLKYGVGLNIEAKADCACTEGRRFSFVDCLLTITPKTERQNGRIPHII